MAAEITPVNTANSVIPANITKTSTVRPALLVGIGPMGSPAMIDSSAHHKEPDKV